MILAWASPFKHLGGGRVIARLACRFSARDVTEPCSQLAGVIRKRDHSYYY